jgi:hypothetical protein
MIGNRDQQPDDTYRVDDAALRKESDDPLLFPRYGFTLSRVIAQRGKPRWNVSVSPDGDLCSAAAPRC